MYIFGDAVHPFRISVSTLWFACKFIVILVITNDITSILIGHL